MQTEGEMQSFYLTFNHLFFLCKKCQNCRLRHEPNLAKAAGSQVDGTACLTWSRSTICPFESATLYSVTYHPSNASDLVLAASFCQLPVNSNMVLNKPDGIFPDKDSSWLNCSDICWNDRTSERNLIRSPLSHLIDLVTPETVMPPGSTMS